MHIFTMNAIIFILWSFYLLYYCSVIFLVKSVCKVSLFSFKCLNVPENDWEFLWIIPYTTILRVKGKQVWSRAAIGNDQNQAGERWNRVQGSFHHVEREKKLAQTGLPHGGGGEESMKSLSRISKSSSCPGGGRW